MADASGSVGSSLKTKLALSRLECPAVLPSVLTQAVSSVVQKQFSREELVDVVSVSPALVVQILRLAAKKGVVASSSRYSLSHLMGRLPADEIRNAILDLPVYEPPHSLDRSDESEVVSRQELVQHSVAVACCAKALARLMVVGTDTNLAYLCGLLHDLGKLAVQELMPKGFSAMAGQAKMETSALHPVERCYLSTDHGVIGKYLARKWQLPQTVQMAIWLHHSNVATLSKHPDYADMAAIVYCADAIVKSVGLGASGSFDTECPFGRMSSLLKVREQSLRELQSSLPGLVNPVFERLHLAMTDTVSRLCRVSKEGAALLGRQNCNLAAEIRRLEGVEKQLGFVKEVMDDIDSQASVRELAEVFAKCWQRFFQTGKTCIIWGHQTGGDLCEAVLIEDLQNSRHVLLDTEGGALVISSEGDVVGVDEQLDWVFDQLDCDFAKSRSFTVPLVANEDVQAAIIFEMNYPVSPSKLNTTFAQGVQVGDALLSRALTCEQQEAFAEDFLGIDQGVEQAAPALGPVTQGLELLNALAEMAAGFAHELNNPLSVIAGRAQLMGENESEEDKRRSLHQIRENVGNISDMLGALISFAEPPLPKPSETSVVQLIEEAVQLASYKSGHDDLDVAVECAEGASTVYVDSAQIVSALANVLVNSVESYRGTVEAIQVVARSAGPDYADIVVCDQGCGMDDETLQRATTPFFSAKPAGRQRGMGLAYAARVIQVNQGRLVLQSRLGQGTEVLISLPKTEPI
ncbi:MAG: HDOD domain-containing protein [Phycisphaeraceae bacterium]|nr:HDOD domain-containing protein [Phycisphaeraceae bacterium]